MNDFEEPSIPPHWRRPLTAAWVSLAVHAAVLVLVQVAPPAAVNLGAPVIEARLAPAALPAAETPPEAVDEAPKEVPKEVPPPPAVEPPKPVRLAPVEPVPDAVPVRQPAAEPAPVPPPRPPEPALPKPAPATAPSPVQPADADKSNTTEVAVEAASPTPAPAASITTAVDLTYYNVRELDVQPRALRDIVPDYPGDADRKRVSGKVEVQLKLEADGRISEVVVLNATPPGVFDASAIEAFRNARFAPAQKGGRPVRSRVVISVVYDWEGRMRRQ